MAIDHGFMLSRKSRFSAFGGPRARPSRGISVVGCSGILGRRLTDRPLRIEIFHELSSQIAARPFERVRHAIDFNLKLPQTTRCIHIAQVVVDASFLVDYLDADRRPLHVTNMTDLVAAFVLKNIAAPSRARRIAGLGTNQAFGNGRTAPCGFRERRCHRR
jgi:hypothetical protein